MQYSYFTFLLSLTEVLLTRADIRNPPRYLPITLLPLSWHWNFPCRRFKQTFSLFYPIFVYASILTENFIGKQIPSLIHYRKVSPINRTKNPVPQDSPPAAGRVRDIFPLRRSAILAERFCVIGKFKELSYNTKKWGCRLIPIFKSPI